MKNILVTSDLSENSLAAIKYSAKFLELLNSEVTILYILQEINPALLMVSDIPSIPNQPQTEELEKVARTRLEELNQKYLAGRAAIAIKLGCLDPAKDIIDYANENNFDLIIISSHGSSKLERLLIGSVTEQIINKSQIPVLTVKAKS